MNSLTDYLAVKNSYSSDFILNLLDLTLLNAEAKLAELDLLRKRAASGVAAICVLPMHLTQFQQVTPYKKATVVNFPTGQDNLQTTLKTIRIACDLGADEIDYVFPYKDYLSGSKSSALAQAETVLSSCQRMNLLCKVILETGAFDYSHLYQLSCDLIQQGHDFLKTSTGRITPGATPKAVFELLRAIKDTGAFCGIKISGGIKTVDDAQIYMSLATKVIGIPLNNKWFRLGASSLITSLLKQP